MSAWLLPAVTRQWDDRQKARELKASLITEIASGTANALLASGQSISQALGTPPRGDHRAGSAAWIRTSFRIDAQLGAYFPGPVRLLWSDYSSYMGQFLTIAAQISPRLAVRSGILVKQQPTASAYGDLTDSDYTALSDTFYNLNELKRALRRYARNPRGPHRAQAVANDFQSVAVAMHFFEDDVDAAILAGRPISYSTTWSDFLHGLLP